jgi:hypothetical protein
MKKQNYSNHKRYYPPHHFVFLPLVGFLTILGAVKAVTDHVHRLEWLMFSILAFCLTYLALMLRQHYALGNQNRIVRLEFRLRYFECFGERSEKIERQLSFAQIAALRFAGDGEFESLLNRVLKENLPADEIKKAIKDWQADSMRV